MRDGVEVVAIGARTPVGLGAESSAAAVRARISRRRAHPLLVDELGEAVVCAYDAVLPRKMGEPDRLATIARGAAAELVGKLEARRIAPPPELPVFLAVPVPRPGFGTAERDVVVRGVGEALSSFAPPALHPVSGGNAATFLALELACQHLREGRARLCVVGGVDGLVDAPGLAWLDGERRLARQGIRGGITPGEGAAMLVLCRREERTRAAVPALAELRGVATGQERRSLESDEGTLGEGLTDVVRRAARDLRLPDEAVDDVYCDLNGERHRTDEWGLTVLRAGALFRSGARNETGAAAWGDVGAASGALGCVLAIAAWQRGYARGPRALVWGSSREGLRGAAVLQRAG